MTDVPAEGLPSPPRVRMDPRIRERRIAVKRDEGRRRLRVLLVAGGIVAAVGFAFGLTRSPLFDVDEVRVLGATNTTALEVAEAAGLDDKPLLADLEPAALAAALERLPWVQDANVVRHWPGTVEVTLVERTPIATVPATAGGWAMVDASGRVLAIVGEPPPGMVQVAGPAAPGAGQQAPEAVTASLAVLEALPPSLSDRVNGLTVAGDGTFSIHAVDLPIIHFGPPTRIRAKLVALSTLVARANLRGVDAIDVRVPTAPALTR